MNEYYKSVTDYFNSKADEYDDVDQQAYWVLSDNFFKAILKKEIGSLLKDKKDVRLLDAGAGTGRWTFFFYELFKDTHNISGDLIDISDKMLEQAAEKIQKLDLSDRFHCAVGNIENLETSPNEAYDLALSFYNVLSFVENPLQALTEIKSKLVSGGVHVSIVANKYHAYYFSILTNQLKNLDLIKNESKIRFNDAMPAIHCFTPEELKALYLKSGFKEVRVMGGPNFIYPGMEETLVHGHTGDLQAKLKSEEQFAAILATELDCYDKHDIVGRGNVLMALAIK